MNACRLFLLYVAMAANAVSAVAEDKVDKLATQVEKLTKLVDSLQAQVNQQSVHMLDLEKENAVLRAKAETSSPATINNVGPAVSTTTPNVPPRASSQFNPDFGVVADMLATSSTDNKDTEGNDRLSVREVEIVFGHDVDPYSRLDGSVSFSDFESPTLEEAYLTHLGLPWNFQTRFGKFHPSIGKAIPMHRDSLETVDEPLVIQEYFGVEGLSKTGIEISNYLPLPWESVTHELKLGFFEGGVGEDGSLFSESRRAPNFNARLKNFVEINDSQDLELGGTFLLGSADEDTAAEVRAIGTDLTYQLRLDAIRKLKLQSEAFFQDRSLGPVGAEEQFNRHPWGMYALADLRFAQRWSLGLRWDQVQAVEALEGVDITNRAWSGYLTFYQSEFARFRLQYQHLDSEGTENDDNLFLQGTFAIGNHKHNLN